MSLKNIEHFVVLMLENRSFDHFFGLRRGVDNILDKQNKPKFSNKDPQGGTVAAAGDAPFSIPTKHGLGPFHNLTDVNEQLFGTKSPAAGAAPTMGGFVASYREALNSDTHGNFTADDLAVVMRFFDPAALPTINALADNFVLCDAWFSEVPGPTHPNRLYMHAGTSQGFVHNVFKRPFDLPTIYELLQRNNKTWAVYDFDLNEVKHFTRIADQVDNFRRFTPNFGQDVENNRLPNYSFIVPRFSSTFHAESNDQHAPHDVRWGEQFIADVYEVLRANGAVWNACAFIVTYDEHGGFPDHVPPPKAVNPDGINSPRPDDNFHNHPPPPFAFDRLGVRVPALIASPWVGKGVVVHDQLQHTSILRTVRDRFGIGQSLSKREAAARSLAPIFDQATARKDAPAKLPRPKMPVLPPPDHHANPGNQFPDDLQRDMMEGVVRATRPSHPEDDVAPPRLPHTQAGMSEMAHRRWSRHHTFVAAQR
jgi:phospholipase C